MNSTDNKSTKSKKRRHAINNFGKIFVDLGKLSFGSLVLGTIIKGSIPQSTLLIICAVTATFGIFLGVLIMTNTEDD